jgi:hypothetical protein
MIFIIFACVWAAVMIVSAIITALRLSEWNTVIYSSLSTPMFVIFIALREDAFVKWLKTEKNILIKMSKKDKDRKND